MTERERWIVYPLLFLALGSALRDKLLQQTTSKTIRCEEMICQQLYCQGMSAVDEVGRPTPVLLGTRMQVDTLQADLINANQYLRAGQRTTNADAAEGSFSLQPAQVLEFLRRSGLIRFQKEGAATTNEAAPDEAANSEATSDKPPAEGGAP